MKIINTEKVMTLHDPESPTSIILVRLLEQGMEYGDRDGENYMKAQPLVEFYDPKASDSNLGRFITRYTLQQVRDLVRRKEAKWISMSADHPEWAVRRIRLAQIVEWAFQVQKPFDPVAR